MKKKKKTEKNLSFAEVQELKVRFQMEDAALRERVSSAMVKRFEKQVRSTRQDVPFGIITRTKDGTYTLEMTGNVYMEENDDNETSEVFVDLHESVSMRYDEKFCMILDTDL